VSNKLPTKQEAIKLLKQNGCSTKVINHCEAVAKYALKIACQLKQRGFKIDLELVESGALLHDIGRSKTHTVHHAIEGVKIACLAGLPLPVIKIIKRHVGGGITDEEAEKLGWPKDTYLPVTLEEKIVSYADKCIDKAQVVSVESTLRQLEMEQKFEAAERVRRLSQEIIGLIGNL
jgi:uncharacterized protein